MSRWAVIAQVTLHFDFRRERGVSSGLLNLRRRMKCPASDACGEASLPIEGEGYAILGGASPQASGARFAKGRPNARPSHASTLDASALVVRAIAVAATVAILD